MLIVVGISTIISGAVENFSFSLTAGFMMLFFSWCFDSIYMKCSKCGMPFRDTFNRDVLKRYRGLHYIVHLLSLVECENPDCKQELE
jgi:hypothetical protein